MTEMISTYLLEGQRAGERYRLASSRHSPQGTAGSQLGRLAGESLEFMDHREYQPGDDLRRLDWSAYARSDKMVVNLYRQEVSLHLDLLLDGSRSIALEGSPKTRAAAGLAAALCTAAANAGHTYRVFLTGNGCQPIPGGSNLPDQWQGISFDGLESPSDSLRIMPPAWRPHGIRILISDLLWLGDPLDLLSRMAERVAAISVIQILAAEDIRPQARGTTRLVDSETGAEQEIFLDETTLARYRANVDRHRDHWRQASNQSGAAFASIVAEDLCAEWDFWPLVEAGILDV